MIMEELTMYLTQTDVQQIFAVIAKCFGKATVFVEIMNPSVVKHMKEKSIEGSHAKFTWGVRGGAELQALLPGFTCTDEHCLTGAGRGIVHRCRPGAGIFDRHPPAGRTCVF